MALDGRPLIARGMPDQYRNASLADSPMSARVQMGDWFLHPSAGLFLWGPSQKGKTALACACALELLRRGMDSWFCETRDVLRTLVDCRDGFYSKEKLFAALEAPDVLILNDVGDCFWLFAVTADLFEPIERRVSLGKVTLAVSASLSVEDFSKFCDARVGGLFSGFRKIEFLPSLGAKFPFALVASTRILLATYWNMMQQRGWIKPDDIGLGERQAKLKEELAKGF